MFWIVSLRYIFQYVTSLFLQEILSLILIIRILFCSLGYFFKVPIIHILSPFLSKLLFCNAEIHMSKNIYRSQGTAWRSQGSNSGLQVWWKASLADEPLSTLMLDILFKNFSHFMYFDLQNCFNFFTCCISCKVLSTIVFILVFYSS